MCMVRDVELMRCNPPCVCRGWPGALLLRTHKGGTAGGEAMVPLCAPTSRPHLSAGVVQAQDSAHQTGEAATAEATGGTMHTPELPRPHLSVGVVQATRRRVQDRAKGTNCARPNFHVPTFRRGSSKLQDDVHSGPRADARRSEGGDASDWSRGSWRIKTCAAMATLTKYAQGMTPPGRNVS